MGIIIGNKEYSDGDLAVLAKHGLLNVGQKNDPASLTLNAPALQGVFQGNPNQYGIFTQPGVRPQRFSTLLRPRSFMRLLGVDKSLLIQEMLEVMTGVTSSAGQTNATGFCGNPPTVGQGKVCQQLYHWGDYFIKTEVNSLPEIGQQRGRWEVPAEILNQPPSENPLIPDVMYRLQDPRSVLQYALWRIGVDLERQLELIGIQGLYSASASNTYTGFFHQFTGLDQQIKTGYRDAGSPGTPLCPAMDSSIISFNAAVSSTIGGGDGRNIVQAASDLYYGLNDNARSMGMDGVEFVWVMRKEQFRAVVEQWACQYSTYRCQSTNAGQPLNTDTTATNALRLEMMSGQYLLIDGVQIPVVFSEGITNPAIANATYEADMYLVPVRWNGMPLLKLEYFDMGNQYIREFADFNGAPQDYQVLNNGMYAVANRHNGFCKEYLFAARMRMILETPFLAGRIDNINYSYRAPTREAMPGTSLYVNGGTTYRDAIFPGV